ncbi:MAG: hemN [Flavipsychrobacter sp.]|nr:hemN [Flavipsychrobacter sp.]
MIDVKVLEKYNVPVPRYTSYPTVPYWKDTIDIKQWEYTFQRDFKINNGTEGISLYIHLPFCESLCTYCGCNKKITTNHSVEDEYITALIKEWHLYLSLMNDTPIIRELHLGGGTPTFFSPANLDRLLTAVFKTSVIHEHHEFSFEGHPNNTTDAHLEILFNLGFRRLSLGVQDNDSEVQRIINRIQPIENVRNVTETARTIGYTSANYDLIYGLPLQSLESITRTINETILLKPDRIAFYSYAHVPWTSKGQRLFDEHDLPAADEKLKLYRRGREIFLEHGYSDIGMDHFALPSDALYQAASTGVLHRNFMGYTTQNTTFLIGLGVSSISSTGHSYSQNSKAIHDYYRQIKNDLLPVEKGYFLNDEDVRFGKYILDISCRGKTNIQKADWQTVEEVCRQELTKLEEDGLITINGYEVQVTVTGKNFIRNICSVFDLYLQKSKVNNGKRIFSNAI